MIQTTLAIITFLTGARTSAFNSPRAARSYFDRWSRSLDRFLWRMFAHARDPSRDRIRGMRETDLFAQLDRSVRFARGCDNRYAADSTMVIVNQGILKIWQDICWLRSRSRISCHTRLAVPPIKYSIMLSNNPSDFRRVMVIAGTHSPAGRHFRQVAILLRAFYVLELLSDRYVCVLRVGKKIVNKHSHEFFKFVIKFLRKKNNF